MRPTLYNGDHILAIDSSTQTIINELGWNVATPASITIVSNDVPDTGLASAYVSHTFTIEKGNLNVQNPVWTLSMPLSDGGTETISLADQNLSCRTQPIVDENRYKADQDGCIRAILNFSCTVNGKEEKALPFNLFLELKPLIEYAKIEKIVDNAPYDSYDAYFSVKYRGAESITYSVDEEFDPSIWFKTLNEPYLAYGVADHIKSPYYAWIDFTAKNSYGTATYTIELQPYGVTEMNQMTKNNKNEDYNDCGYLHIDSHYDAYDMHGRLVGIFSSINELKASLSKGFYIVKAYDNDNITRTFKLSKSQ